MELTKIIFKISDMYMKKSDIKNIDNYSLFLGEVCLNRITGLAFKNMQLLPKLNLPKEVENSLYATYMDNRERAKEFKERVVILAQILENADFPYALLKGALLVTKIYPIGLRTSNDIDILINESDITRCQELLIKNGFIQGYYNRGEKKIIPATRREIIMSRINYGETIPFVKIYKDKEFYVDINFSVDFKPMNKENKIVEHLLNGRTRINIDDNFFYTLNECDFIIHLCCHLYKEATTIDWVKEHRDLQLYKFSDINVLLHLNDETSFYEKLEYKIKEYKVNKECFFVFNRLSIIYPDLKKNASFLNVMDNIMPTNIEYLNYIYDPKKNITYSYSIPFEEWFIVNNKLDYLKIVNK